MRNIPSTQRVTRTWYTVKEAAALSGFKPSMVDYLCRSGTWTPISHRGSAKPGRGHARRYCFHDLVILRALGKLLACGIEVAKLKKALRQLKTQHPRITESALPGDFLVTDGQSIYYRSRDKVLEDLLVPRQLAFGFVIELQGLQEALIKDISSFANIVSPTKELKHG